ncbi:hypothetical protein NDU88_003262 [Pleurodeles waltl]|uniref:Uncharacterized protein n=1 Tax=Pleurodeles waltl TaxID=8319 RepID=A0AAV7W5P1_PLEWA|nr:hypothetical protein NDU88_003262 [Pleurodeles waltl]
MGDLHLLLPLTTDQWSDPSLRPYLHEELWGPPKRVEEEQAYCEVSDQETSLNRPRDPEAPLQQEPWVNLGQWTGGLRGATQNTGGCLPGMGGGGGTTTVMSVVRQPGLGPMCSILRPRSPAGGSQGAAC